MLASYFALLYINTSVLIAFISFAINLITIWQLQVSTCFYLANTEKKILNKDKAGSSRCPPNSVVFICSLTMLPVDFLKEHFQDLY